MFIGKPADLYDRNNPDLAPTQNMCHKKIKCNADTVVSRAKSAGDRAEKRKRCEAASALLEISQEVSNDGNKPLPALGTFLFWE
jgi:hypothetical protein